MLVALRQQLAVVKSQLVMLILQVQPHKVPCLPKAKVELQKSPQQGTSASHLSFVTRSTVAPSERCNGQRDPYGSDWAIHHIAGIWICITCALMETLLKANDVQLKWRLGKILPEALTLDKKYPCSCCLRQMSVTPFLPRLSIKLIPRWLESNRVKYQDLRLELTEQAVSCWDGAIIGQSIR